MTETTTDRYRDAVIAADGALGSAAFILDTYDSGDPWGSIMGALFVLNDVLAGVGGETNDTFRQSPMGSDTDAYGYAEVLAAVESGAVPVEDVERAERILDGADEMAREEGLDY